MKAHIVGGGFGGLAAAAYLIRNAGMSGQDITIDLNSVALADLAATIPVSERIGPRSVAFATTASPRRWGG